MTKKYVTGKAVMLDKPKYKSDEHGSCIITGSFIVDNDYNPIKKENPIKYLEQFINE